MYGYPPPGYPPPGYPPPPWPPPRPRRRWLIPAIGLSAAAVLAVAATFITLTFTRRPAGTDTGAARSAGSAPGTNGNAVPSGPPAGGGWLFANADGVVFVQWTDTDGQLTGTAQVVGVNGQPPSESTSSSTVPVTGTLSGSTISLSFGGNAEQFGTISGDTFAIDFPDRSGVLVPATFRAVAASVYNGAVQSLTASAARSNSSFLASQEQAGVQQVKALCGTDTLTCPQPPGVPADYQPLATFDPAAGTQTVTFGGLPLAVCFSLAPGAAGSVGTLAYQIGQPAAGPTVLYSSQSISDATSGCIQDPGNDTGPETVMVGSTGAAHWVVQIDQAVAVSTSGG